MPAVLFEEGLKSFDKLTWPELSFEMTSLAVQSGSCFLGKSEDKGPTVLPYQSSPLSLP